MLTLFDKMLLKPSLKCFKNVNVTFVYINKFIKTIYPSQYT